MKASSEQVSSGDRPVPGDRIVDLEEAGSVDACLTRLGIAHPRPVVVVIGWAAAPLAPEVKDALDLLMLNALLPECLEGGAVIVSGGTNVGVMAAVGGASTRVQGCMLVGVAPKSLLIGIGADATNNNAAGPEPNHRLITTPGAEWGDERDHLVRIAEEIAGDRGILVVAIGGNDGTYGELEMAARRGWPILLVETGHDHRGNSASDVVARALSPAGVAGGERHFELGSRELIKAKHRAAWDALVAAREQDLLRRVGLADHLSLMRALRWRLDQGDLVLKDAWRRYSRADHAAVRNKRPTGVLAGWVAVLAFLTAALAGVKGAVVDTLAALRYPDEFGQVIELCVTVMVTALPLIAVVLLGLMERIARTRPWIEQRLAAEAIVAEIYRFRALAPQYNKAVSARTTDGPTPARMLASTLRAIEAQSEGRSFQSTGAPQPSRVWPPGGACERVPAPDLLLNPLGGTMYDRARVQNQIDYHDGASVKQDRKAMRLAVLIFSLSAATTLALTLSWKWDPLTGAAAFFAAAAAALVAWRTFQQRDGIATSSLSTIVMLRHAQANWLARPAAADETKTLRAYVTEVEDTMAAERLEWQRAVHKAQDDYLAHARSG